jgi:hypothetical protein
MLIHVCFSSKTKTRNLASGFCGKILLTIGKPSVVTKAKNDMMRQFECDNVSKIEEFLGNKIEIDHVSKTQSSPSHSCYRA